MLAWGLGYRHGTYIDALPMISPLHCVCCYALSLTLKNHHSHHYSCHTRGRLSRYMLRHEPSSVTGRLFVFRPVGGSHVGIGRGAAWCALRRRARAGLRLSNIAYGPILALTAARALTSRRLTRWPSHDAVGTRRPPWSRHGTTQRARTREAEMETRLNGVNCGL